MKIKYTAGKNAGQTAEIGDEQGTALIEQGMAEAAPDPAVEAGVTQLTETVKAMVKSHVEELEARLVKGLNTSIDNAKITVKSRRSDDPTGGFKNLGEFAQAVRFKALGRGEDPRLKILNEQYKADGMDESVLADGGALVPTEYSNKIYRDVLEQDVLFARCRQYPINLGNSIFVPVRSIAELGVTAASGGSLGAWLDADGVAMTPQKPVYTRVQFVLNRWGTLLPVTDELLQDNNVALGQYIFQEGALALSWDLNQAIINGTGLGQPTGILASSALVSVPAASGQANDTVVYANLVSMLSTLWTVMPNKRENVVWIANPDVEAQLAELVDPSGRNLYFAPGTLSQSPQAKLFGIPIIWSYQCPALGDAGDIILADLDQYGVATKARGEIEQAISMHFYFDAAEVAYRMIYRIAGQPMRSSTLKLPNSSVARSGFVCIAPRGGGPAS